MRALRAWVLRLWAVFRRGPADAELGQELESHLQMHIADNVRAGMSKDEARRQALIKLGGIAATKEMYRERRGLPLLDTLVQDVRYGVRVLGKSRGFTLVAVATLALGIGVNTAIFTAFDALVLRPRPVKEPERLVSVFRTSPGEFIPHRGSRWLPVAATPRGQRPAHRVHFCLWQLFAHVWSDAAVGPHPLARGRSTERRTGGVDERKLLAGAISFGSESRWIGYAP